MLTSMSKEGYIDSIIFKVRQLQKSKACVITNELNSLIDDIHVFSYKNPLKVSKEKVDSLIWNVCSVIPAKNLLLFAKCSQLIVSISNRQKLYLSDQTLKLLACRSHNALSSSSGISHLDILQLLKVLLASHGDFFSKDNDCLLEVLTNDLENRVSLVDPGEVLLTRSKCLLDFSALPLNENSSILLANGCLTTLYSCAVQDVLLISKVWALLLGSIVQVLPTISEWLKNKIDCVLGCAVLGLTMGLVTFKLPKPLYPIAAPSVYPTSNSKASSFKPAIELKKQKNKLENTISTGGDYLIKDLTNTGLGNPEFNAGNVEVEEARARLEALNLILQTVKVCNERTFSGYYTVLLSQNCLQLAIKIEPSLKLKMKCATVVKHLLCSAKPYLSHALHSESGCFTSYSQVLSEVVTSMHSTLCDILNSSHPSNSTTFISCLTSLVTISPYQRLQTGLIPKVFSAIRQFLNCSDSESKVEAVKCLNALISSTVRNGELLQILHCGDQFDQKSEAIQPWIVKFLLSNLKKIEEEEIDLYVVMLVTLNSLIKHHMDLCYLSLDDITECIIVHIKSHNKKILISAFDTFMTLLEQLGSTAEYKEDCNKIWKRLLSDTFIPFLQDGSYIAAPACDCISYLNSSSFQYLGEASQITLMTLLYGCCSHEHSIVRKAAFHTLGSLLVLQDINIEPFIYDIGEILIKSVSDDDSDCRYRAVWALGNLSAILKLMDRRFIEEISILRLINSNLSLANDRALVKACVARSVGLLLSLMREENFEDEQMKITLSECVNFLIKTISTVDLMKVRWNACYASSLLLQNECLYAYSSTWLDDLLKSLCGVLTKCNHFKLRLNACIALCSVPERVYYGQFYLHVWQSILDGLDNSSNMPDFRESKHQNSLFQQLCVGVCHLSSIVLESDLIGLSALLEFRQENLLQWMHDFFTFAPPELTAHVSKALRNIVSLSSVDNPCLTLLMAALTYDISISTNNNCYL